ncbi:hypothetical protein ACLMJK_004692 [Lecanora helva]
MDPLSMTASIIEILKLTSKLTSYIQDVKNASAEQRKVVIEATSLHSLLTGLRYRVETARSEDPWFNQVKQLGTQNGPLDQFRSTLEEIVGHISASTRIDRIKTSFSWKFTKKEVESALQQMERLKSFINCALTETLLTLSQAKYDMTMSHGKQIQTLDIRTEELQSHAGQELQNRLSQWLGLPDPSTNFHAALEKRHPETGLWLMKCQQFEAWKSCTSSLLWLHGNAGCGKTILSAVALQEVLQSKATHAEMVVSYFYFDFNDMEKQSSEKAIRSILFQFALQNGKFQMLERLYQQCSNGSQQPAKDMIRSLLRDTIVDTGHKYIILDALDECTNREEFMRFIRKLIDVPKTDLHVMITSRREKDIEDELDTFATCKINIQSAIVNEDIRTYVYGRLALDKKLQKWSREVQEEIATSLMKKADGMFRWVYCQLESLRQCVKLSALKRALSTLPKTLDETYERILQAIETPENRQDAIKALRWLCFSAVPLDSSQIIEVLAIENGDNGGFDPDERLPDPADIRVICSSLISCDKSDDSHGIKIRLAHFSVKEYLLSDRCFLTLDFQAQPSYIMMAEDCLHYLLFLGKKPPMTESLVDEHPLSRYAAEYWWQHAQAAGDTLSPTVTNLSLKLLTSGDAGLLPWIQLYNTDDLVPSKSKHLSVTMNEAAPPLYYAASIGLPLVVKKIIPQVDDIDAGGGSYYNALQVASVKGYEIIVQILLKMGADVNAQGGDHGNALQAASLNGNMRTVKVLLDAGADVNAQGGAYGNALQAAVQKNEKNVKLLLDAGANVNAQGGCFHNALQAASSRGNGEIVKLLVDAGADINAQGGNALQAASSRGNEEIVKVLLDAGADVNALGVYGSALQAASADGNKSEKIITLLLNAGADTNAQGGHYGNALQAASAEGHEKVVRLLLRAGAEINTQGGWYGNALQAASSRGNEEIIKVLLDAGADVNAQGGICGNALQAASSRGNEEIVKVLLDAGADVNALGGLYGNALRAAFVGGDGNEEIINLLLNAGVDVNAQGGDFASALYIASAQRRDKVVKLLLDAGADVNAQGGEYGNALQAASAEGNGEIVKLLLNAGADVNAQGGKYGNALQAASAEGDEEIVNLLLNAGADVNAQGGEYGNALRAALEYGHERVAQILQDAGAEDPGK